MRLFLKRNILLLALFPLTAWALTFPMPPKGDNVVGKIQHTYISSGDNYTNIAQHYGVGYYEIFEANPTVDPDRPKVGTELTIPTKYILPAELHNNIVINIAEMRLYYASDKLKQICVFPIGIGRQGWGTPTGAFKIVEKKEKPSWVVPKSIRDYRAKQGENLPAVVPPGPDNPLGDYSIRLSRREYLIHGTNDSIGIGRRSSAGCIRMYPKDIERLFALVEKGTPVNIINKPYKFGRKNNMIYVEAHMPLHEHREETQAQLFAIVYDLRQNIHRLYAKMTDIHQVLTVVRDHLGIPQTVS